VYGGIGLGPLLGDAVYAETGYRTAFILAAGCATLAAVLAVAVPSRVVRADAPDGFEPQPSRSTIDLDGTGRSSFVHPAALATGLVLAVGMAAYSTFSAFLPDHARSLGLSGSGGLFALYSAVCLALRLAGARLPERLGPRLSVTVAFGVLGIGLALLAAVPQVWALWAAAACVGVGMAFMYPSLMAETISRAADEDRPRAISSFTMFFEVGTAVGGLLLGVFADVAGKRSGFAVAVVLCVAGVWLLRTVVLPRRAVTTIAAPAPAAVTAPAVTWSPVCGD
jgi:MFS family permease